MSRHLPAGVYEVPVYEKRRFVMTVRVVANESVTAEELREYAKGAVMDGDELAAPPDNEYFVIEPGAPEPAAGDATHSFCSTPAGRRLADKSGKTLYVFAPDSDAMCTFRWTRNFGEDPEFDNDVVCENVDQLLEAWKTHAKDKWTPVYVEDQRGSAPAVNTLHGLLEEIAHNDAFSKEAQLQAGAELVRREILSGIFDYRRILGSRESDA